MSDFLNEAADAILNYLFAASVVAATLTVLSWLIIKLGRIRAAVYRHMVWLYCLIGVAVLPPLWLYGPKLTLAILPAKHAQLQPVANTVEIAAEVRQVGSPAGHLKMLPAKSPLGSPPGVDSPRPSAVQPAAEVAAQARASFPTKPLLAGLWLAGFGFMLTRLAVGWHRLRRIRRSATPVIETDKTARMNRRGTTILLSCQINTPVCFGVFRTTIILPRDMYANSGKEEMRMVLSHELAHVERRDYLTNIFQSFLEAVFFFHPLVWYASRQLINEREQVCDNSVLARGATANDYAKLLSSLAEQGFEKFRLHGVALFEGGLLKRIRSLLDPRRIRLTNLRRITAGCVAFLALSAFTGFGIVRLTRGNSATWDDEAPSRAGRRARVQGVVADEEGKPVEGAIVNVLGRGKVPGGTRTPADGTFVLDIDKPTLWYVTLLATADRGARQGLHASKPTLDSATPTPIRIVLKPSLSVRAHVTNAEGKPVSGAEVEVLARYKPVARGRTDEKGIATIKFPAEARVDWVVALKSRVGFDYFENYESRHLTAKPGDLPKRVKLVLDGARRVRIKALDSKRKPVPNVAFIPGIIRKKGKRDYVNLSGSELATVRTNRRGIAYFEWIPRDFQREIDFWMHDRHYHCPQDPTLPPSGGARLTARLLRNTRIGGKVFLPDGKPAAAILIQAEGRGDTNNYCRTWARTAADGSYVMAGIFPNQSYIIAVIDDTSAAPSYTGIIMRENQPRDDLDFHLTPGTLIHGRVTSGPKRERVKESRVTVVQQGAEIPEEFRKTVYAYDQESLVRWTETDEEGRYALRVGPGDYEVSTGAPRHGLHKKEKLTIGTEKEIVLDFHLGVDVFGKPLPMKFTALDGREVDTEKMREKVILVHFWAASDDKCVRQLFDVKRAYEKYHPKGFEIVGISLDTDKNALEKTIKEKGIPWPQHFDGRGRNNRFATEYSISEIPTMWLIGKDGKVVDMDVSDYALGVKVWKVLEGLPLTGREPFTSLEDLSENERKAVAEFEKAYSLSEGENLKYMGPPFLPSRDVYFRYKDTFQWEVTPEGPDNWYFRWSDGLKGSGMSFGKSGIRSVLRHLTKISPEDVEGDEELLDAAFRGDFIFREGLSVEKIVSDFQDILQRDLKLPVRMTFREVPRQVIVARGAYRFTPVPGRPADRIEIYGKKLEDPLVGGGGGGDFEDFLNWVGMYIERRVINEVENPPEGEISWHYNDRRQGSKQPDLVLQHLTEQTGLTFKKETRRVGVLFVERRN